MGPTIILYSLSGKCTQLEENENIVISNQNGKIVALHNAIVSFNTKEVTENTLSCC